MRTPAQEHKQRSATAGSGDTATDLVSYVEFQRNYRMLLVRAGAALCGCAALCCAVLF